VNLLSGSVWFLEFSMVGLERNYYIGSYGWSLFHMIFFIMQFVCVYSSIEVPNGSVLMLNGMVEWESDNGNCRGAFSVDSYSYNVFSFVYGNIKVVYCVAPLNYEINVQWGCLVQNYKCQSSRHPPIQKPNKLWLIPQLWRSKSWPPGPTDDLPQNFPYAAKSVAQSWT